MNTIKILITGDFAPQGRILNKISNKDYSNIFNDFTEYLEESDINITNLECPLTENNKPISKVGPLLKAPLSGVEVLKKGHFTIAALANNHILDFGYEGLKSTIDSCQDAGIETVGAGLTKDEINRHLIVSIKNKSFGFINVAESEFSVLTNKNYGANPIDIPDIFNKIKFLKKSVDKVIIIAHGGHEFYKYPSPEVVKRYRMFIDFGANAVIGHHPHCHSGYEAYNNGLIFYSLGNFIFDWPDMKKLGWNEGYAVQLSFSDDTVDFNIIPYKQGTEDIPGVRLLKVSEKQDFDKELIEINNVIANPDLLQSKWETYVDNMENKYMMLIQPTPRIVKALQSRKYLPNIFFKSSKTRLMLLNLIRCESHREMLTNVLQKGNK